MHEGNHNARGIWAARGGRGDELMVLLHGIGANATVWTPFIAHLEAHQRYRWLAPDLRGHGRSAMEGPFDFVFSDADKGWLKNYFIDIDPKLVVGGCFTTHNISRRNYYGQQSYLEYIESLKNYESTLNSEGAGMLISYKRAEK